MANEPSFILDAKAGGMNWGYCEAEAKLGPIQFTALVQTSSIVQSETK